MGYTGIGTAGQEYTSNAPGILPSWHTEPAEINQITVDAFTAPGTNPVVPTGGNINIFGSTVAAHSIPLRTDSLAANTFNVEAQITSAVAATDATKNGFAHFANTDFGVDASGFVTNLSAPVSNTFSPTLTFSGGNGTMTFTSAGKYWKIGPVVFYNVTFTITAIGTAAGSLTIGNFPFTAANDGFQVTANSISRRVNYDAGFTAVTGFVQPNTTTAVIQEYGSGQNTTTLTASNFQDDSGCTFAGFFWTS